MRTLIYAFIVAQIAAGMPAPEQADVAWIADGEFCEPETVLALPDDTLLVSNVCGFADVGTGFLTSLAIDGEVIDWRILDKLDAPLGMTLAGDRLHVVDNNQIKIFRWPDFEMLSAIALDTVVANDIAVAEDQTIYVTDTSRHAVVVVSAGLEQSILTGTARFQGANGIQINGDDLYVGGERLWHVDLRDDTVTRIGPDWLNDIDGIEIERDGTLQITPVGGPLIRLGSEIEVFGGDGISSANHGYAESHRMAILPTGFDNTVVAIRIGQRGSD